MGACRETPPVATPAGEKIASLEQGLDRQRGTEAYLLEVSSWTARIVENASEEGHTEAENTATALNLRIQNVRTLLGRARADRFSGWNPALAAASRELNALQDAHYRALANLPGERRGAERAMAERLTSLGQTLVDFRVEASSFSVSANPEIRRRVAALELARREASDILKDVQRSPAGNWPYLRRRWDRQVAMWTLDLRTAMERLGAIADKAAESEISQP